MRPGVALHPAPGPGLALACQLKCKPAWEVGAWPWKASYGDPPNPNPNLT
jgi:hypothetical protein